MYKIDKNKPFYFTLKALIYTYNLPQSVEKSQLNYFWLIFTMVKILAICAAVISPLLHAIIVITNKIEIDVSEDWTMVFGAASPLSECVLFTLQFKKWIDFMNDVACFDSIRDISAFQQRIKYFNRITTTYWIFIFIGIPFYEVIKLNQTTACNQLNEERDLHEICGTLYSIWLPIDLNLTAVIIITASQIFICWTFLPAGAIIPFVVWESTELLIIHINILNENFTNLFEGPGNLSDRLRFCINYHVRIISLANRLNVLVKRTVSHMAFLAAIVFGLILNQAMRSTIINGILLLIGYIITMFALCLSGEKIKNETLAIGDAIWMSNWHKADAKTMKDLAFIMFRSQKPCYLEALPLGIFDYALFIAMLKTSYSYLTLLNQTM